MRFPATILAAAAAACAAPAIAESEPIAETVVERVQSGETPFDQAAREAQVASGDLRIAPANPKDATPEMRALSKQMNAFFGSKSKGNPKANDTNYRHPRLYYNQVKLGLDLNRHGTLPPREREMVILRTAWLVRSPFEWGEHVTFGKTLGLTSAEIERITLGSSAPGWSEHDRAVLRGVEELHFDHALSDATWAILDKSWNEQQLLELPGLVGSYTLTAMIFNSLRVGLMPGNGGFGAR